MRTTDFLHDLTDRTTDLQAIVANTLRPLPTEVLNFKSGPGSWSVLECLEHLNRYGRYYLPVLTRAIAHPRTQAAAEESVHFSWLGRKSYDMVRPDNGKAHKTLARMNPAHSQLTSAVLDEFLEQLTELQALLVAAEGASLNQKVIPVEFFKLLKLQLGEALLFVIAHCQRHVAQAVRVCAAWKQQAKEGTYASC